MSIVRKVNRNMADHFYSAHGVLKVALLNIVHFTPFVCVDTPFIWTRNLLEGEKRTTKVKKKLNSNDKKPLVS